MYMMYVDESGDPGVHNSPTRYFILSAIVVHELRWNTFLDNLIAFRKLLKQTKGLKMREEIHASHFINNSKKIKYIKRNDRLDILKKCINWLSCQNEISIITVRVDKNGRTSDVFNVAWERIVQRFENTIRHHHFPGPNNADERGILLPDNTDGTKLIKLIRRMKRYNPISNMTGYYQSGYRNMPLEYVIEDPLLKDSNHSYIIQMVDVIAYFAMQYYQPNKYINKKAGKNYYGRLDPVINPYVVASNVTPFHIVEL
jgi:hypothetical protein